MTSILKYLTLFFSVVMFTACTNSPGEKEVLRDTILKPSEITKQNVTDQHYFFDRLIWTTDFDTTRHDFVLIKNRNVNADTLTPQKVIDQINSVWNNIFLQFKKISHDTIYVSIPDSYYLTEKIGTFGANEYMSSTTYNLTELNGIKYVHYDFEEGEHLSPGTMTRDDYKNYR